MKSAFAFLFFVLSPALALAQDVAVAPSGDLAVGDAISQFAALVGGIKGVTALSMSMLVVQAALLFFRTAFANFTGKAKWLIVSALTLVAGTLSLVATGTPAVAAVVASLSASSFQVYLHQGIKQLTEKSPA
jgi:hypothetical protein